MQDSEDAIRRLLLLMPRLVGRAKRLPVPEAIESLALSPRHLSMLAILLFDGPLTVNMLAERLEVAPTTISLLVSELLKKDVLQRRLDAEDRRRHVISIAAAYQDDIHSWLSRSAAAWRQALAPLTAEQRTLIVNTLLAFEDALTDYPAGAIPAGTDNP